MQRSNDWMHPRLRASLPRPNYVYLVCEAVVVIVSGVLVVLAMRVLVQGTL